MMDTPVTLSTNPIDPEAAQAAWFGHPRQLARLFSTEAMERFGFYGLRALLVLYLVNHFGFGDGASSALYGGMLSLTYLTPFIGGLLADRFLGYKRAVKFGALVMCAGYLLLCFGGESAKPYALIDGQRYDVKMVQHGKQSQQFVVDHGQMLRIKGNEDKSVSLINPESGNEARHIKGDNFKPDAERNSFFVGLTLLALTLVSIGTGFFKPNISTIVGALYAPNDRRRDAGFSIFYMGINLGALFSQFLCPILAVGMGAWTGLGYWAGFGLAAIGMLIAWALFQFSDKQLAGYGEPPEKDGTDYTYWIYAGTLAAVGVIWLLFNNVLHQPPTEGGGAGLLGFISSLPLLGKIMGLTFLVSIPAILIWSWKVGSKTEFEMMLAAMVLVVFNVVFWTLFEQAGSSLTLFAERNTNLSVFGWFEMTSAQTQVFNSLFVVILAPVFAAMWVALAKRNLEPSIPVKFALALMGAGAGFWFLVLGTRFVGPDFKVGIWWLAGLYLIHTLAELSISPVGLSMITKLSITRIVGLMMGVWFLSIAMAEYVGGVVAGLTTVKTVGGTVTNVRVSLETYVHTFTLIGSIAIGIGVVLLLLAYPLRKWMHGVK